MSVGRRNFLLAGLAATVGAGTAGAKAIARALAPGATTSAAPAAAVAVEGRTLASVCAA